MEITFAPLNEEHFELMLKWLCKTHIRAWWDDIDWTMELIIAKYSSYVAGFKLQDGTPKRIQAYVIKADKIPIGYVRLYNAYEFPRSISLENRDLPNSLAAFDIFIAEQEYLGRGVGSRVLQIFLDEFCEFNYVFADPQVQNIAAIRTYEKAGFKIIAEMSQY